MLSIPLSALLTSSTATVIVALALAAGTLMAYFRKGDAKVWQDVAEGWEARARLFEQANTELTARVKTLELELAELRGKTDLTSFEARQIERDRQMMEPLQALVIQVSRLATVIENGNGHS